MGTVTVRVTDAGGAATTKTVPYTVGTTVLFGATADPQDTAAMVAAWPNSQYMREYGVDGEDPDTIPDLTVDGTGKYAVTAFKGIYHQGWKDDVNQAAGYRITTGRKRYWTWYHEPVDNMTGASYVTTVSPLTGIIANHPDKALILGHGPCLTRWQIYDANPPIDPRSYWYPGATIFFADSYNPTSTAYRTPELMFGPIRDAAADLGVDWGVPEWGGKRLASDPTGTGRASWIRDCIAYLREQPRCRVVGWWDRGETRVSHMPSWPEFAALAEVLG